MRDIRLHQNGLDHAQPLTTRHYFACFDVTYTYIQGWILRDTDLIYQTKKP